MPLIAPQNETEPNNTTATANLLSHGVSMRGTLSSATDIDFFRLRTPSSINNGNITVDVSLTVPAGARMRMEIHALNQPPITFAQSATAGADLYFKIINLAANTDYFIRITAVSATSYPTAQYMLNANITAGRAWYGQFDSTLGGVDYWNPNKLNSLNITNTSVSPNVTRQFFVNNAPATTNHWMRQGCFIASMAMVLRNMHAGMQGYDFRTDYTGFMMADPFTVMFANNNLNGTTMNVNSTTLSISGNPIWGNSTNVATRFNVRNSGWTNLTGTEAQKTTAIANALQLSPAGVIVGFQNANNEEHYVVFNIDSGSGTTFNRFFVSDSAARSLSTGQNVRYNSCATATTFPPSTAFRFMYFH
jgi:hypothetical protein